MDNESHSVRPPEFPKPSASSTLQKHRLQSRLLLGYHSTIGRDRDSGLHSGGNNSGGHNNGGAGPGGGVMYGSDSPSVAGYGYGEALFESRVLEGAGAGAAESSMWSVADSVTTIAVANGRVRDHLAAVTSARSMQCIGVLEYS